MMRTVLDQFVGNVYARQHVLSVGFAMMEKTEATWRFNIDQKNCYPSYCKWRIHR